MVLQPPAAARDRGRDGVHQERAEAVELGRGDAGDLFEMPLPRPVEIGEVHQGRSRVAKRRIDRLGDEDERA